MHHMPHGVSEPNKAAMQPRFLFAMHRAVAAIFRGLSDMQASSSAKRTKGRVRRSGSFGYKSRCRFPEERRGRPYCFSNTFSNAAPAGMVAAPFHASIEMFASSSSGMSQRPYFIL